MRFILNINQPKAIEWGLSLSQAILFSYLHDLPTWAKNIVIDGETFYWTGKSNIICELPILTDKPDTVKRHMIALEKAGLIKRAVHQNRMMICVTEKGKTWNKYNGDLSEPEGGKKITPLDKGGEKNPEEGGFFCTEGGEKNHPDQYIKDPIKDPISRSILQIDPNIRSVLIEDSFEKIFWPEWEGRKIARGECLSLFRSLVERQQVCPQAFATMLAQDINRRREGGQQGFDKIHPKSYLKGRRWGDQVFTGQVPLSQESSHSLELKKLKQEIRELQIASSSEQSYRDSLKPNQPNYATLLESSCNKIALYDAKIAELIKRLELMGGVDKTPQNRF